MKCCSTWSIPCDPVDCALAKTPDPTGSLAICRFAGSRRRPGTAGWQANIVSRQRAWPAGWAWPAWAHAARAAGQIDASIAAATRRHITRLLTARDLQGIGWVLTDAVYLNARWASPFQHGQTSSGRFTTSSGQQVSASFLHGGGYVCDRADGWTAVSLPYRGGKLSMTALLPDSGAGGRPALSEPALARIGSAIARGSKAGSVAGPGGRSAGTPVTGQTAVALPKVSLSSKATMNGLLSVADLLTP